eukprot:3523511-Pleurochrysis_carterae.AAC.1
MEDAAVKADEAEALGASEEHVFKKPRRNANIRKVRGAEGLDVEAAAGSDGPRCAERLNTRIPRGSSVEYRARSACCSADVTYTPQTTPMYIHSLAYHLHDIQAAK